MKKNDQNPHFQIWLEAYGQRLIEVTQSCGAEKSSAKPPGAQSEKKKDSGTSQDTK